MKIWCPWLVFLVLLPPPLTSGGKNVLGKKEIHLAGIFPINGVEGWQGGQVRDLGKGLCVFFNRPQPQFTPFKVDGFSL